MGLTSTAHVNFSCITGCIRVLSAALDAILPSGIILLADSVLGGTYIGVSIRTTSARPVTQGWVVLVVFITTFSHLDQLTILTVQTLHSHQYPPALSSDIVQPGSQPGARVERSLGVNVTNRVCSATSKLRPPQNVGFSLRTSPSNRHIQLIMLSSGYPIVIVARPLEETVLQ